jgi:hypothetical protein
MQRRVVLSPGLMGFGMREPVRVGLIDQRVTKGGQVGIQRCRHGTEQATAAAVSGRLSKRHRGRRRATGCYALFVIFGLAVIEPAAFNGKPLSHRRRVACAPC